MLNRIRRPIGSEKVYRSNKVKQNTDQFRLLASAVSAWQVENAGQFKKADWCDVKTLAIDWLDGVQARPSVLNGVRRPVTHYEKADQCKIAYY